MNILWDTLECFSCYRYQAQSSDPSHLRSPFDVQTLKKGSAPVIVPPFPKKLGGLGFQIHKFHHLFFRFPKVDIAIRLKGSIQRFPKAEPQPGQSDSEANALVKCWLPSQEEETLHSSQRIRSFFFNF